MADLWRIASWFFLAQGGVYFVIGILTPIFMNHGHALFYTARSDSVYFGASPEQLQERDPALAKYREMMLLAVAGLLVALGLAVMAIAWFAVRAGAGWGYWSIGAVGVFALAFWVTLTGKYVAAGAPVGLGDIPPFMWFTTVLWAVALVAGAFGLRTTH
jgi:hypothetical protein